MRPGFNPARRNRNQGTAARGHGRSNRMSIPDRGYGVYWESVGPCACEVRFIHRRPVRFVVEAASPGSRHFCSVPDVCHILENLPPDDLDGLSNFVFRQPTRKQQLIAAVWGRLDYASQLTINGVRDTDVGPALFLEAQPEDLKVRWGKDLSPGAQAELEQLRNDGHQVVADRRAWIIRSTPEAIRNTQLYRTLLHELGHWVDYLEKVVRPSQAANGDFERLSGRYHARPYAEREAFAHRYAIEQTVRLINLAIIPFSRIDPK
jgi:hypothetical protein